MDLISLIGRMSGSMSDQAAARSRSFYDAIDSAPEVVGNAAQGVNDILARAMEEDQTRKMQKLERAQQMLAQLDAARELERRGSAPLSGLENVDDIVNRGGVITVRRGGGYEGLGEGDVISEGSEKRARGTYSKMPFPKYEKPAREDQAHDEAIGLKKVDLIQDLAKTNPAYDMKGAANQINELFAQLGLIPRNLPSASQSDEQAVEEKYERGKANIRKEMPESDDFNATDLIRLLIAAGPGQLAPISNVGGFKRTRNKGLAQIRELLSSLYSGE